MLLFLPLILLLSNPILDLLDEPPCVQQHIDLHPVEASWEVIILDQYENGMPLCIEFIDPTKEQWPCKRLFLYDNGHKQKEVDLSLIIRGSEEGALVEYYPSGQLKLKATLHQGVFHGAYYLFSEQGEPSKVCTYQEGILHGEFHEFYPDGCKKLYATYIDGLPDGALIEWYENGRKKEESTYKGGVLHGRKNSWYSTGALASSLHFQFGLPHGVKTAARERYSEKGDLLERAYFIQGTPEGEWIRFHPNGQLEMRVQYRLGKKEGAQEYFDEEGNCVGCRTFKEGKLVGKAYRFHPHSQQISHTNSQLAWEATFDQQGNPLGMVIEYTPQGLKLREYSIRQSDRGITHHGIWREWKNRQLIKELSFDQGELHGKQTEYYPAASLTIPAITCEFNHGLREGVVKEWHANGTLALESNFHNGELQGLYKTWYQSGAQRAQGEFQKGAHGNHISWHENGTKATETPWVHGQLHGSVYMWGPQGEQLSRQEWNKGVPEGTWSTWYGDGTLRSEMHFKEGELTGLSREWHDNGQIAFQLNFQDGLPDSWLQRWFNSKNCGDQHLSEQLLYERGYASGEHIQFLMGEEGKPQLVLREFYSKGILDGRHEEWFGNGKKAAEYIYKQGLLEGRKTIWNRHGVITYVGDFHHGRAVGRHKRVLENGMEEIATYSAGQLDGLFTLYYQDQPHLGKIKAVEAGFVSGQLDGDYMEFTPVGSITRKLHFKDGVREGEAILYSKNCELLLKANFQNGKLEGVVTQYHPNGVESHVNHYVNGVVGGEEKGFYPDGKRASLAHYLEGKLHGVVQEWSHEGVLLFEAEYEQGLRHGKFNKYYEDGTPRVLQRFSYDRLISKECFSHST